MDLDNMDKSNKLMQTSINSINLLIFFSQNIMVLFLLYKVLKQGG